MQYLRGWRALRADPQWLGKIGVAIVAMFVPVVGPIVVVGWQSLALRRAVSGQDAPLPRLDFDLDYLTKLLSVAFKGFIVRLLWQIPTMLVTFCFILVIYIALIMLVIGAESGSSEIGIGVLVVMLVSCLVFPFVIIVLSMPLQIAMMRAEITDDIKAGMQIGEVFRGVKMLWKELFKGIFVMTMLGFVAGFFGLITMYLGLFPAIVVLGLIGTYYTAEIYKVYLEKGGEPLPIGPLDVQLPPPHHHPHPHAHHAQGGPQAY